MEYFTLRNGVKMPKFGFGVFQVPEAEICRKAVTDAIASGYRLIDTAAAYFNEEAVGQAVREAGVDRSDLFITTKLWIQDAGYDNAMKAFDLSMKKLGLDYIDLYLIHQPFGDYYGSWRAMEELYRQGRARAIGVCNFYPDRLMDLAMNSETVPHVNQIELHPFFQQPEALKVMSGLGVQAEAWGPLAEGGHGIFTHPVLTGIGAKYGKSAAQVALRWNVQRGAAVIPKSTHIERIRENMDIFDFSLDAQDMAEIEKLDLGESKVINHFSADTANWLNGWHIHD